MTIPDGPRPNVCVAFIAIALVVMAVFRWHFITALAWIITSAKVGWYFGVYSGRITIIKVRLQEMRDRLK